ncbi:glycoside hydrolase family 16 protein [Mumia zhuanghuii]|uniref:Glycoside hydrolase family 16 protein n=2 Tax=Mumia TaxID=1546255 RepID=A0ABW1QK00_9ACTN|nr:MULTISPECIES: glycoside hydrolase family 16 protein [Mumia]KAA1419769.1 glycoside hydrolase family 16 protein [Mumia zhuanghuii]
MQRDTAGGGDRIRPGDFVEDFAGADLDPTVWIASYLPAWSSRAAAAATYAVADGALTLSIPPAHPLWCPDLHDGPLRVSAVQSGSWSGPVGSTRGQQPFREGLVVREAQPTLAGFTPTYGVVEVTCRAEIGPRSMFSAWMVGVEDEPERCGEICLVEVFGDAVTVGEDGRPVVAYGAGIHAFRDPALVEEFRTEPVALDVAQSHTYGVDWRPGAVDFLLDGAVARTVAQAPAYPMQLILGVFDFPDRASAGEREGRLPTPTARLVVERVVGRLYEDGR